ncbi:MAG: hypothetical protein K8R88_00945 [Armatimonadetes bacterium]|nr:hypothetical protein [Armatimonadota bacterium]
MLSIILALKLTLAATDNVQVPTSHPNNLILDSSLAKIALGYGGRELRVFHEIGYSVFSFDSDQKEQIYKSLQSQFGTSKVCLDLVKRPAFNPNDFYWPNMYHPRAVRADLAWI